MLLLRLSREGESLSSLVCVRLLLWPGRLVRLSILSVSERRGATEYVLLQRKRKFNTLLDSVSSDRNYLCRNQEAYWLELSMAWVSDNEPPSVVFERPC